MMENLKYVAAGIFVLVLLCGCIGSNEESQNENIVTTVPTTSIECILDQEGCEKQCESTCSEGVDYCIFDEGTCSCRYECYVETTSTSTTTIPGRVTCDSYCRANGYESGECRKNPGECRSKGVKEIYKPRGNRYCPKNRPEDSCCCKIE